MGFYCPDCGKDVGACPECIEQSRLLGMSAEREADLLGELERERALADRLGEALEQAMHDDLDRIFQRGWIDVIKPTVVLSEWKEARSE